MTIDQRLPFWKNRANGMKSQLSKPSIKDIFDNSSHVQMNMH